MSKGVDDLRAPRQVALRAGVRGRGSSSRCGFSLRWKSSVGRRLKGVKGSDKGGVNGGAGLAGAGPRPGGVAAGSRTTVEPRPRRRDRRRPPRGAGARR